MQETTGLNFRTGFILQNVEFYKKYMNFRTGEWQGNGKKEELNYNLKNPKMRVSR